MRLKVFVKDIFPQRSGKKQDGTTWYSTPVVFEESTAPTWPQSVLLEIFGEQLPETIKKGARGTLYFGIMARASKQGNLYNNIRFNNFLPEGAEIETEI